MPDKKPARGGPAKGDPGPLILVVDDFEDIIANAPKVKHLCTPANKNGEGVLDDVTHLESYSLKAIGGTPPFAHKTQIQVDNQLGTLFVDAIKRDSLLVPTNKSLSGPATAPDNGAINVDHYKCYKVKVSPGAPKFEPTTVDVTDQFIATPKTFTLKKLKRLCNAVDKNGEGIKNAGVHLACYQAKAVPGQAKHVKTSGVNTANQFGSGVLGTVKETEVCIPSITTVP